MKTIEDRIRLAEFELDGEKINIVEFINNNEFCTLEIMEIAQLKVGETLRYGGGAQPLRSLKRIK